jgi:uncharacterized protein
VDAAILSLSYAVIAFLVAVALRPFDKRITLYCGLLFAIYLSLDDLATGLPSLSSSFRLLPGQWNWTGKIYSILLSVAVILAFGLSPKAVGLTLQQRNLRACLITLALSIPWGISLGLMFKPGVSAETLAFQALMPGLAEELAVRGVAPALLLGLFRGKEPPQATPWTVVFIAAIMFGVWHGLGYTDGSFSFEPIPFLFTSFGSVVLGWLRFSSGSLLFPFLVHGAANVAFQLTALVGA